jgi:hypothetical protein
LTIFSLNQIYQNLAPWRPIRRRYEHSAAGLRRTSGRIAGKDEEVALKRHHSMSAAWGEFLATYAAQGPGVIPVLGVSVDSAQQILAVKAYHDRYGLNNFLYVCIS